MKTFTKFLIALIYLFLFNTPILIAQDSLNLVYSLDFGLPPGGLNTMRIGENVSVLGDINGDGYDDWASVGGVNYESGTGGNSIHFFLGGPDRLQEAAPADYIIYRTPQIQLGNGVWKAGDVNNDGYDDVLLFCYYVYDTGGEYVHALYYGGEPFDTEPDVLLRKMENHGGIANFSADAGDVNSDGFDDVLLSVSTSVGSADTGHVYLYYGGTNMDAIPDVIFNGPMGNTGGGAYYFGMATAAGDVNNDGFGDIIVSSGRGGEFYLGAANMDTDSDALLNDFHGAGIGVGPYVADAGDVNNDGFADILMWANVAVSKAFVYYGGDVIDGIADVVFSMWKEEANIGINAACAGDVNNDGFDDILLGTSTVWSISQGEARIFYGSAEMDTIADFSIDGPEPSTVFGYRVAGDGDFDGDGYSDFLIGDIGNSASLDQHDEAGSISLFYGGETLSATPAAFYEGSAAGEGLGSSVAHAGDINNDGFPDIIIGAANHFDETYNYYSGRAYVYLGGGMFDKEADLILDTATPYNGDNRFFGQDVGSCGDINNDGFSDFYVTEKYKALIFLGSSEPDSIADYVFSLNVTDYGFCAPGDVNNDGYDDILVGKPADGASGRVYLYLGSDNLMDGEDMIFSGEISGDNFGKKITAAGDLNNDGFADFLVSAPGNDHNGSNTGAVMVFFGGAAVSDTAALVIYRNYEGPAFDSERMDSDGDINNDGFSDIIIGNPYFSETTSSFEGKVDVFLGSSDMDSNADLEWTGNAANRLGGVIYILPDMNSDGYDEFLVNSAIYYGGAAIDTTADVSFPYQAYQAIDLDAFYDFDNSLRLLVGSPYDDAAGPGMGRVSVYSSSVVNGIDPGQSGVMPTQFALKQNYPNPFNPTTTIKYSVTEVSKVSLILFNLLGQEIITLVNDEKPAGNYSVNFNAANLPSGVYFYRLQAGNFIETKKMILLK